MPLKLRIKSGPLQGREYALEPGHVIGRARVQISIDDAKLSGRHAKIETGSSGELVLIDLGSTNGIRVNNKKLAQITLSPGLLVKIGNTECEILSEEPASNDIDGATLPPLSTTPRAPSWSSYLAEFTKESVNNAKNHPKTLLPFKPLLVLNFTRGVQAGTEWVLGFGPREIGLDALDLHLFDSEAPPVAFSVCPLGEKAVFSTKNPQKVRLNGRFVSTEELVVGDTISIGETIIKVSYRE